ncbi:MAG: hypothetical protein WD176_00455, partial [Pirellulales bacterium]
MTSTRFSKDSGAVVGSAIADDASNRAVAVNNSVRHRMAKEIVILIQLQFVQPRLHLPEMCRLFDRLIS